MSASHRRIVITGVTKGLGLALVHEFIQAGHQVFGCGRSAQAIAQLQAQYPQGHHFAAVDVAQPKQVHAWAEQMLSGSDAPDLLINNASLINQRAPVWQVPSAEFAQLLAVNVSGVVHVLQAFLPAMLEIGRGVIVNVSSSWGRRAEAGLAPYCASKFAIEGLTQALALELPAGLAAVSLDPGGGINTEMLHACLGSDAAHYQSPQAWAKLAAPFVLGLSAADNGKALTVPKNGQEAANKSKHDAAYGRTTQL